MCYTMDTDGCEMWVTVVLYMNSDPICLCVEIESYLGK